MHHGSNHASRERVTPSGAVLLGRMVEADGYVGRQVRVVTHFHSDHTLNLELSARRCRFVVGTPATLEALQVLGAEVSKNKLVALDYGRALSMGNEKLTLVYSRHVMGSAQVLVEEEEGVREGYTGDFKVPGTKVMRDLDLLVIDATYGAPHMVRPFKGEVEDLLADLVASLLGRGMPVTIFAYYGKMQEVMEILRERGVTAPYLMPRKAYELTKVAVRYGAKVTDFHSEDGEESKEIERTGWYVRFLHYNSSRRSLSGRSFQVYVTGRHLFDVPVRELGYDGTRFMVALSDHADFEETLLYVEEARPRALVVDSYRAPAGIAHRFAEEVMRRVPAVRVFLSPSRTAARGLLVED